MNRIRTAIANVTPVFLKRELPFDDEQHESNSPGYRQGVDLPFPISIAAGGAMQWMI